MIKACLSTYMVILLVLLNVYRNFHLHTHSYTHSFSVSYIAGEKHIWPKDGVYICEQNLHSQCPRGSTCPQHHVDVMYQWQVNVFDNWESFTLENDVIEMYFCSPGNDSFVFQVQFYIYTHCLNRHTDNVSTV